MKSCAVLIPVYKKELSSLETETIKRIAIVLKDYPIILVQPRNSDLKGKYGRLTQGFNIAEFDSSYFSSIADYNRLMLSLTFYERFQDYSHILIAQPDCFIFQNNLSYFLQLPYDFIGAPWVGYQIWELPLLRPYLPWYLRHKSTFKMYTLLTRSWPVGNGGLSLRRIKPFIETVKLLEAQGNSSLLKFGANEDNFWSFAAPQINPSFKVAPFRTALNFSFEINPTKCLKLNNRKLPFGCHAFEKHQPEFWLELLENLGESSAATALREYLTNENRRISKLNVLN